MQFFGLVQQSREQECTVVVVEQRPTDGASKPYYMTSGAVRTVWDSPCAPEFITYNNRKYRVLRKNC